MKRAAWVPQTGEAIFFWSDLKAIIRRIWWRMALCAVAGFTGGVGGYIYNCDFKYVSKATYRLQVERLEVRNPLVEMILGSSGNNGHPGPYLTSRTICEPVIKRLGLQVKEGEKWPLRMRNYALWGQGKRVLEPPLSRFSDVQFVQEEPLVLQLKQEGEGGFSVWDKNGELLGKGEKEIPFIAPWGQFTVHEFEEGTFTLVPLLDAVESVAEQLEVTPSKTSSEMYELQWTDRNRFRAARALNGLMEEYQCFLKRNHDELSRTQMALLQERKGQLTAELEALFCQLEEGALGPQLEVLKKHQEDFVRQIEHLDERTRVLSEWNFEIPLSDPELGSLFNPLIGQLHDLRREKESLAELSLDNARFLVADLQMRREGAAAALHKYRGALQALDDTQFPLGGLAPFLPEGSGAALFARTAQLEQQLLEPALYTEKERERMGEEMRFHRRLALEKLRQQLHSERFSLQLSRDALEEAGQTLKGSLDRQMELLQAQGEAWVHAKRKQLQSERKRGEEKLSEIQEKIRGFAEQLRREQLLKLQVETCSKAIQGLAQEVESRQIEQQIHHLSSKPCDWAVVPLRPVPPRVFFWGILFGVCGLFVPLASGFTRGLRRGFPISGEKLQILRYPYAGRIHTREAMQRIALFADRSKRVGLILGQGAAYQGQLEQELQRLGITFQVLVWNPEVRSLQELVFLSDQANVSMTLIVLRAQLISAAAESLLRVVDRAVVTAVDEPLEDLTPYMKWGYDLDFIRIAFLTP